jgi:hypothetical protein
VYAAEALVMALSDIVSSCVGDCATNGCMCGVVRVERKGEKEVYIEGNDNLLC